MGGGTLGSDVTLDYGMGLYQCLMPDYACRYQTITLIMALQTIAAYLCVHLGRLDKLQGKAVTHFCEVEWWRTLMVECVTVF